MRNKYEGSEKGELLSAIGLALQDWEMTHNSETSTSGGRERRGACTQWPGFSMHCPRKRDRWYMEVTPLCEFGRRSTTLRLLPQMGGRGMRHESNILAFHYTALGKKDGSSRWAAQLCKIGGRHTTLKPLLGGRWAVDCAHP